MSCFSLGGKGFNACRVKAAVHLGERLSLAAVLAVLIAPSLTAQSSAVAGSDSPRGSLDGSHGGTIENSQITASWKSDNGHLCCLTIEGHLPATRKNGLIHLDDPFAVELRETGVLRAADFEIQGSPTVENLLANPAASRFADRLPGVAVDYQLTAPHGKFKADWRIILRQGSSYVREVLTITTTANPLPLSDVRMIDLHLLGAVVAGTVKGSPVISGDYYLGLEQPLSESSVVDDHAVSELHSEVSIGPGQSAEFSAVIGVAVPGQMRRSFLSYIERERAHPYRTFLHYNSWFDIGFFTPYTQQDALDRIHAFGEELTRKRGVKLDSFLFDDGWDDHNDLWKIRGDFKGGFTPLQQAAAVYDTAPGVWLSPWGGYGPPKQERIATGKRDNYEIVDGGLALSGPRYYERFHSAAVEMVKKYGINQFKFDGTGNADQVVKGSKFSSDFDAAIHLINDLRVVKPDLFINLTTGTYPSPFWLFYADSIWRGGDDTEFAGVGTSRERWITYRDADTYNEIVKAGRLFPLNSLMLHGIVYAQKAPHLSDDPGHDFRNEVRSYFGSGTQLQELYITPSLLNSKDWDVLAEAAKWSRGNAATLVDTHWIGGDPRWLQVYGWAAWSHEKGIITLRNPNQVAQDFSIDVGQALELPSGAAPHFEARSPWADEISRPSLALDAGKAHTFHIEPYQVLTLELLPR